LFSNIIHVNVKLKEAQNQGTHIFHYDKYCRGAKDYFSLARELITQEGMPQASLVLEKRMKKILKERLPQLTEVIFSVFAPEAGQAYVAGDFNNWKVDRQSLMEKDNGTWRKKINLGSGKFHYRFVIDGKWTEDTNNPAKEMNPYGSLDSLMEIRGK
jgi:hypothetical protein